MQALATSFMKMRSLQHSNASNALSSDSFHTMLSNSISLEIRLYHRYSLYWKSICLALQNIFDCANGRSCRRGTQCTNSLP